MKFEPKKFTKISYEDHSKVVGEAELCRPLVIRILGFILKETDEAISIVHEIGEDGETETFETILKRDIVKRRDYRA